MYESAIIASIGCTFNANVGTFNDDEDEIQVAATLIFDDAPSRRTCNSHGIDIDQRRMRTHLIKLIRGVRIIVRREKMRSIPPLT